MFRFSPPFVPVPSFLNGGSEWLGINTSVGKMHEMKPHITSSRAVGRPFVHGIDSTGVNLQDLDAYEMSSLHSAVARLYDNDPVFIFYGRNANPGWHHYDGSIEMFSYQQGDMEESVDFVDYEHIYEFSNHELLGMNITGMWLPGYVLNYLLDMKVFHPKSKYFVARYFPLPTDELLSQHGMMFVGAFFHGRILSRAELMSSPLSSYQIIAPFLSLLGRLGA